MKLRYYVVELQYNILYIILILVYRHMLVGFDLFVA